LFYDDTWKRILLSVTPGPIEDDVIIFRTREW